LTVKVACVIDPEGVGWALPVVVGGVEAPEMPEEPHPGNSVLAATATAPCITLRREIKEDFSIKSLFCIFSFYPATVVSTANAAIQNRRKS
jgi:hypothetical protein